MLQGLISLLVAVAAPGVVGPSVQAHRGGPIVNGRPAQPESTMPAFRAAAARDEPVELDLRTTSDGVLVVMHDATLERTTVCAGPVSARTAAQLIRDCPTDRLGSPRSAGGSSPTARRVAVPMLADVLALMRSSGLHATLEIKDRPAATARSLAGAVQRSGVPLRQVQVHSFIPAAIVAIRHDLPGVATSSITAARDEPLAIARARRLHVESISPQWPVDAAFVRRAHAAGLRVVPWTLDSPAQVLAAARVGVDVVMTDDPVMTSRVLAGTVAGARTK
ncbi:MAG: glpQ [Solirubrobacterales bacterium]|jgi:glycerophosphoryl diester phosphodiesterase|nr:glpQ [Solirubrobacterales bacterium]